METGKVRDELLNQTIFEKYDSFVQNELNYSCDSY